MMTFPKFVKLRPRERLLSVGSGLVVLAVVLDRVILNPWLENAHTVREDIQQMEQSLQRHTRLMERKDIILSKHERYQRYLKPPMPDNLQMAELLKEIEDLARESKVHVEDIKPSDVETTPLGTRYSLEVRFDCTLEEWVDFIYRIETSTSLYEVVRAGLERQEEDVNTLDGYLRLVKASPQYVTSEPDAGEGDVEATE